MKMIFQLLVGYFCGLLMIKWLPLTFPIDASELFVSFVFNPLEFFAACIMFILGIIVNGNIIKGLMTTFIEALKRRNVPSFQQCLSVSVVFIYLFLLKEGFWQTLALICFSVVYGMISFDFRKEKTL
ncbi:hypothetical protein [Bacillus marasmi]|uniref:hypothetical protein n=1 Tax=Bacillus marasmi TaxID=1926279 RepID=UPI0011CB214D|nr:hypothetical protein [Bacillus marasmi]